MKSRRFELSEKDFSSIIRQIFIIYTPVIYLFLDQLKSGEIDYRIILALLISTTADILRRYLTNYQNEA